LVRYHRRAAGDRSHAVHISKVSAQLTVSPAICSNVLI
jgi:hypothetical protein